MGARRLAGALLIAVSMLAGRGTSAEALEVGASAPDIAGGPWINSEPLSMAGLKGRVVLVEFWTYG